MAVVQTSGKILDSTNSSNLQKGSSISEPDLATAGEKLLKSGFPPGTTVDELWHYRRKRRPDVSWIRDSLKPEEGSFKQIKSEYKRRFKDYLGGSYQELTTPKQEVLTVKGSRPADSLVLEGPLELNSEYNESFIEYPIETTQTTLSQYPFQLIDHLQDQTDDSTRRDFAFSTEFHSKYTPYPNSEKRKLFKRPTTLKLDGEFYGTTENAEKFIQYLLYKKQELARRRTVLKLEGLMDTKTEMQEQYKHLEYQQRPPLCKKFTNLHLEGEFNITTEQQEQFIPYNVQQRPALTKQHSNLHLEGELDFLPEYRREFVEYKSLERSKLVLPANNLKTDGFYEESATPKPLQEQLHPQIPFLRGGYTDYGVPLRLTTSKSESNLQRLEESKGKREGNLFLEGRIDMNPEYRNAYIDYYKTGRGSPPKMRSRRVSRVDHLKSEGSMDIHPEYSCSFVDFPRERPSVRKPECSLSSEGEWDHVTENHQKYVPHQNVPRTEQLKREPELKLEGRFECQPEYRRAYIDYLIRERVERKPRPLDKFVFDEVVSDGTSSPSICQAKPPSNPKKCKNTQPVPSVVCSRVQSPARPQPPSSASTSSVPTSPKIPVSGRKRASPSRLLNRSLSQIESTAFGPKLTVPKPSSRTSSPTGRIRSGSSEDSEATRRRTSRSRRFDSPVRVENLAYRSGNVSPVPPSISSRKKWMKDDSVESNSAFVVLDGENNVANRGAFSGNVIYKTQKYKPSWCNNYSAQ